MHIWDLQRRYLVRRKGIKVFEGNKGLNELWNMVTKTNRRDNSRQDGTQSVSRKNTSM